MSFTTSSILYAYLDFSDCYQDEIPPEEGEYCKNNWDNKYFCNGTKNDCVFKGKEICLSDPNCYGIMYNSKWASEHNGVKMCTTRKLQEKLEKDWSIFLLEPKCDSGMYVK